MTANELIYKTLTSVCPGAYAAYALGKAPALPWFVYDRRRGGEFFADDTNYALMPRYRVQLLFKENDPGLIERFEAALSKVGTWSLYNAEYLDSEGCLFHDYRLSFDISKLRETEPYYG